MDLLQQVAPLIAIDFVPARQAPHRGPEFLGGLPVQVILCAQMQGSLQLEKFLTRYNFVSLK
jgi:hypothetical protein